MSFESRYQKLNRKQKQAVDLIDGPVMVVAGPGTGKTELLSMRVANILKQTDTLPENILCLTFTDSGADAMRSRLIDIIGQNAYKVAVHTFHSFGTEIINQNSQFFYGGASFKPVDELTSYQLLREIFEELDHSNPLASKMNGEFVHLKDMLSVVSQLKKSGFTSSELFSILDSNQDDMAAISSELSDIFSTTVNKNTAASLQPVVDKLRSLAEPQLPKDIQPYSSVLLGSLQNAIELSQTEHPTKPITRWKNQWLKKDSAGKPILKSQQQQTKLRAAIAVYDSYLARMQEAAMFDFDDMILQVVHGLETQPDLRFNVQEKYQYVMVDEFQDTNMAQSRILHNLTDNPVNEGRPNIMVVGDDDQAIYGFQGADVGNIISFTETYPAAVQITLTDNYRSVAPILKAARKVITQGSDRMENRDKSINKQLTAHHVEKTAAVAIRKYQSVSDERAGLVSDIAKRIRVGEKPNSIAVLAKQHKEILSLLPYFNDAGILVNYEKRDNVLENDLIILVHQLASAMLLLSQSKHSQAQALLPEILSHPAWGIEAKVLWRLSLSTYQQKKTWLEIMETTPELTELHGWLVETARQVSFMPLERILDRLVGANQPDGEAMVCPLFSYFFSEQKIDQQPDEYLKYLEALRTIRTKLREFQPNQKPTLQTFLEFIELHQKTNTPIMNIRRRSDNLADAVNLMTVHKSKGLEFETVYIFGGVDKTWGEKVAGRNDRINYPENLPLAPAGATLDERLRLFFVAMTRAKNNLIISYAQHNDSAKETLKASFLLGADIDKQEIQNNVDLKTMTGDVEREWYAPLVEPLTQSMKQLLGPSLEHYKLSATHLNNFIDISKGGPRNFLLSNLLHFPSAMSPSAAFGSAIHNTLQKAHNHLKATRQQRPLEDVLSDFEKELADCNLSEDEFELMHKRGVDALSNYLSKKYGNFSISQQAELDFSQQQVRVSDAHLTGKLDLVDINPEAKTILVTDYKTGKPTRDWKGTSPYDKIKLHHYRQQLMFYQLLIENSRDYSHLEFTGGVLQFVEPDESGEIHQLEDEFSKDELDQLRQLINAVWNRILNLDFPDTSGYSPDVKGIKQFEADLIDGKI